jgi:hypothetical protein
MNRSIQGLCIILGSAVVTAVVLAAAVAWGPHQCLLVFPKIIGCAIGSYEALAGGMIAAATALFAGWLAWSGVSVKLEDIATVEPRFSPPARFAMNAFLKDQQSVLSRLRHHRLVG